jgi:hypothetical protein
MAGLGRKEWSPGDVLTSADVNGYLMDQSVMVFAGTAARASAIPTPSAGMVAYSTATQLEYYDGAAWEPISITPVPPGLIPLTPTSVAVGSGSATINAGGSVTFTGASSVSLNGVFSSTYTNYYAILNMTATSTEQDVSCRLRASGTDTSTSTYQYLRSQLYTSYTGSETTTTGFYIATPHATAITAHNAMMTFYNPNLAVRTAINTNNVIVDSNGNVYSRIVAGNQTGSTQFDGFTLYVGGNFAGTVMVYGYTN